MALDLKILLYLDDARENLYLEDTTGLYSATNLTGYNTPNLLISSVTDVTINVTILGTVIEYIFTVASGVVTAATVGISGATPIDILADLPATNWPFDYTNPFNITPSFWSATLPTLEDQVYEVEYIVDGSSTYTTEDNYLVDTATCCCISKAMIATNINNKQALVNNLIPTAYLAVANYALDDGLISKANSYLSKAAALCAESDCGCGC